MSSSGPSDEHHEKAHRYKEVSDQLAKQQSALALLRGRLDAVEMELELEMSKLWANLGGSAEERKRKECLLAELKGQETTVANECVRLAAEKERLLNDLQLLRRSSA